MQATVELAKTPLSPANSNYSNNAAPRHRQTNQTSIIRTGQYAGLPKRPQIDRTRYLTRKQVRDIINAAAYAKSAGLALNAQITVTWQNARSFEIESWAEIQTAFFDKMSRHLKEHGVTPAFIWTRERQHGKGPHTHGGIHLGPKPASIVRDLKRQLDSKFGFDEMGIKLDIGKFGLMKNTMRTGMLRYALKALAHADFRYTGIGSETENIGHLLGIGHRGSQGMISIKRAGASQNITKAARKAAGWAEIRELERLGVTLAENV